MAWLTAREALALLGVRPQTLYANVTRGRIQAKPDPADSRRSLYHARDVERLASRRAGGRSSATVAADTIVWGEPILPSAIATVVRGRLYYRGQDAAALAAHASLEEVAALLWEGDARLFDAAPACAAAAKVPPIRAAGGVGGMREAAFLAMAARAAHDEPAHGRAAHVLRAEAAGVFHSLRDALLAGEGLSSRRRRDSRRRGDRTPTERLLTHARLARAWRCQADGAEVLRQALVLLADHELNASTFAARVAASTGASLSASVLAGLAALSGPLHGGAAASLQALIDRAVRVGAARALRDCLAQGRLVAGFGHPLYPDGDIRARIILAALDLPPALRTLRTAAEELVGEQPNVDFALAALTATLRLPPHAAFVLFATARTVGWLAHALEQLATGRLIRPRARYTGPPIASAEPLAGRTTPATKPVA